MVMVICSACLVIDLAQRALTHWHLDMREQEVSVLSWLHTLDLLLALPVLTALILLLLSTLD